MISQEEIDDACKEETEALLAYYEIAKQETDIQVAKTAARKRLMLARATKQSLLSELINL